MMNFYAKENLVTGGIPDRNRPLRLVGEGSRATGKNL